MSQAMGFAVEGTWGIPARATGPSLMTPLGVVEGEVLAYLDGHRIVTLRHLNRTLASPPYLVMMAVGALIRAGLVRGVQNDLDVILKPRRPLWGFRWKPIR